MLTKQLGELIAQTFRAFLQFVAQGRQERRVKLLRARDVVGTDSNLADHAAGSWPEDGFETVPDFICDL